MLFVKGRLLRLDESISLGRLRIGFGSFACEEASSSAKGKKDSLASSGNSGELSLGNKSRLPEIGNSPSIDSDNSASRFGAKSTGADSSRIESRELTVEPGASPEAPLTIGQLNEWITAAISANIPKVWVAGEISDLSMPRSGHIYLALKDDSSQIRAVVWRSTAEKLKFRLEDGQAVLCFGRVDVYAPRGSYQIVIDRIEPQGIGALQIAFQQLFEKLAKEGLFEPARKKPIPKFPSRIGFVTSPSGAAIRDFLEVLRRRWPGTDVLIIPAKVQGEGAAAEIARGIELAQRIQPPLDTLVVGRGGGSTEDLWCFNEEIVVRAIAACRLPVVSAVGHEFDVTLSDLAADVRALTPSEAAELVVPSLADIQNQLSSFGQRAVRSLENLLRHSRSKLDLLSQRPIFQRPEDLIQKRVQRLDELQIRLEQRIDRILSEAGHRIGQQAAAVEALSPLRTLSRGYSVLRNLQTGEIVVDPGQISLGDEIENLVSKGKIRSTVTRVE